MDPNPYQSPYVPPEAPPKGRPMPMSLMTMLAVPLAAIAGAITFMGAMMLVRSWLPAIPFGWVAVLAVLLGAMRYYRPSGDVLRSIPGALAALVFSSPVAIGIGIWLGDTAYGIGTKGGDGTIFWYAAFTVPFVVWSIAGWIELRWEHWKMEQLTASPVSNDSAAS